MTGCGIHKGVHSAVPHGSTPFTWPPGSTHPDESSPTDGAAYRAASIADNGPTVVGRVFRIAYTNRGAAEDTRRW
jgi:hypothetical protein